MDRLLHLIELTGPFGGIAVAFMLIGLSIGIGAIVCLLHYFLTRDPSKFGDGRGGY